MLGTKWKVLGYAKHHASYVEAMEWCYRNNVESIYITEVSKYKNTHL